jgi:hypothetical protein
MTYGLQLKTETATILALVFDTEDQAKEYWTLDIEPRANKSAFSIVELPDTGNWPTGMFGAYYGPNVTTKR